MRLDSDSPEVIDPVKVETDELSESSELLKSMVCGSVLVNRRVGKQ